MVAASNQALLMFSGGLDSVQALHARCVAGERTRLHHVTLRNRERRADEEQKAVLSVRRWLHRNGYSHLVEFTQSTFDYGDLRHLVRDHNIWGLVAGIVLADPRAEHITQVVRTFHLDSVRGGIDSPAGVAAEAAWRHCEVVAKRPVEFIYPQAEMTKADIIAALPPDLLRLCWYCRRPRGGQVCHRCHTCLQVDAALAGRPWTPLAYR